jgi:hypothetical protein
MRLNHGSSSWVLVTASLAALCAIAGCGDAVATDDATDDASGAAPLGSANAAVGSAVAAPAQAHVPDEVLVQFIAGASAADKARVRSVVGGAHRETIRTQPMQAYGIGDLERVSLPPGLAPAAAAALAVDPAVVFAEPNWIYGHQEISNDTYYESGQLWGMYGDGTSPSNAYGSQAGEAWAAGHVCNATVHVGVIDEGIMVGHADLAANVWTNPFDPVDGVDNDGNGYVDDDHGWDFERNERLVDNGAMDHGTHVAGTIGAAGGNGAGVAGVCWDVTIISAQFLGRRGGYTSDAVKAVDYLTDLRTRHGMNVVASNNSWGGGGFSQALRDAIERANAANILFVAAAGNASNNNDTTPSYPSSYTNANVIAVAALTNSGALASFSSYGASSVDIGAPGVGIVSSVPGKRGASAYGSKSGTSMATPHVTGAAALYASSHPGATAAQIKGAILGAAIPTSSLSGKCVTGGRLSVQEF